MNNSVLKFPNVFFYSFFKPKIFLENAIKSRWRVPGFIVFIEILTVIFLPNTASGINKMLATFFMPGMFKGYGVIIFLILFLLPAIFKLASYFIYSYLIQRSFIQHELKELMTSEGNKSGYWHCDVGFFNITFISGMNLVTFSILGSLVCNFKPAVNAHMSLIIFWAVIVILIIYTLYVQLLTLKILFNKKGLFETFFWQWGKGIIATSLTVVSLFGILAIPFILLNINSLKKFYPTDTLTPSKNLLDKFFIALPFILFISVFSLVYYFAVNIKNFAVKDSQAEKVRLEELMKSNPSLSRDELLYLDKINLRYKKVWDNIYNNDLTIKDFVKSLPESMIKVDLAWEIDLNGNLIEGTEKILNGSGYMPIDDICLLAIKNASPYPAPIESVKGKLKKGENVNINFEFKYNIYRRKQ